MLNLVQQVDMSQYADFARSSSPKDAFSPKRGPPFQEQYVRLRAGRDGGQFLFPANVMTELSGTMKGMIASENFRESRALVTISSCNDGSHAADTDMVSCEPEAKECEFPYVIAVDGPGASGKGTLCKSLASRLNFAYLDTGSL
jgi:hypothetical protein